MTPDNGGSPAPAGGNPSGAAPGNSGGTNSPSITPDAGFFNGLQQAENRELVAAKGWDKSSSPDVVITSYRELEGRLGKSVVIPAADSPREDYEKLYTALGKPAKPDGYSFTLAPELPADFPYDDQFATEYRNWAHAADLTPRQAQTIHDKFTLRFAKQMAEAGVAMQTKVGDAHQKIVSEWGPPDSESYKRNVDLAGRALRKLGLTDTYKAAGLLTRTGQITDAKLAFSLATIGEGLYSEDRQHGDPGSITATNPWKEGQENLTEQGRIQRENPELARTLIVAAGKDPNKTLWQRT